MILDKVWGICGMTSDVMPAARIFLQLIADFVVYLGLLIRRRKTIAAENLFLRRQLAPYQERKVGRRKAVANRVADTVPMLTLTHR